MSSMRRIAREASRPIAQNDLPRGRRRLHARGDEARWTQLEALGLANMPVCMAKTQYSFTDDAKLARCARAASRITVRERDGLSPAPGFVVVALAGNIMTMPGLPKHPAAMDIDVDVHGKITGCSKATPHNSRLTA